MAHALNTEYSNTIRDRFNTDGISNREMIIQIGIRPQKRPTTFSVRDLEPFLPLKKKKLCLRKKKLADNLTAQHYTVRIIKSGRQFKYVKMQGLKVITVVKDEKRKIQHQSRVNNLNNKQKISAVFLFKKQTFVSAASKKLTKLRWEKKKKPNCFV